VDYDRVISGKMVTVSHLVKKLVGDNPFLEEALGRQLLSNGNLAEELQPKIEKELGKRVKVSAIVMALRRYSEEIAEHRKLTKRFNYTGELLLKTSICDFTVAKSPGLLSKLKGIYSLVDFGRGDALNVILGNNEISIVINEKYSARLAKFLKGEKILNMENGLVSLTIIFTADDFVHTPGVIFNAVRKLAWNNINIYEVVSTKTELTFILSKDDSMKAYEVLQDMIERKK
jgi:hypothetical protein